MFFSRHQAAYVRRYLSMPRQIQSTRVFPLQRFQHLSWVLFYVFFSAAAALRFVVRGAPMAAAALPSLFLEPFRRPLRPTPLGKKAAFHLSFRVPPAHTHMHRSHSPHSPKPFRHIPPLLHLGSDIPFTTTTRLSLPPAVEHQSFSKYSSPWPSSLLESPLIA